MPPQEHGPLPGPPRPHLLDLAEDRLASSSHLFLRHVRCDAQGGVVSLHGKVPSFYLKQTAQALLQSLEGVDRIDNRLVVVSPRGVSSEPA